MLFQVHKAIRNVSSNIYNYVRYISPFELVFGPHCPCTLKVVKVIWLQEENETNVMGHISALKGKVTCEWSGKKEIEIYTKSNECIMIDMHKLQVLM